MVVPVVVVPVVVVPVVVVPLDVVPPDAVPAVMVPPDAGSIESLFGGCSSTMSSSLAFLRVPMIAVTMM